MGFVRAAGPAIEYADGRKQWWINGENLSEQSFNKRFAVVELTLEQIAAKFGVDVKNLKIVK